MDRSLKVKDLMVLVRAAVENGQLIYSTHASIRMGERNIIKPEIEYVLETGHHEAKKDKFNVEFGSWDYVIKGKTVDNRNLRIIIALIHPNVLIVAAIDLCRGKK